MPELEVKDLTRITRDPQVMGGKPCIRGMRVTVGTLVGLIASGHSVSDILKAYPYLEEQDIWEALAYAAWRVEGSKYPSLGRENPCRYDLSPDWVKVLNDHGIEAVHWYLF